MHITWEDRKQRGNIDNQPLTEKPALSFQYAWFLVTDTTAQFVETHAEGHYNKDMSAEQRQEVIAFYQAWAPPKPTPPTLEELKQAKHAGIDRRREEAFDTGLSYDISGQTDIVQTRMQDKINLLGLRIEAQELNTAGVTDAVMPFRAESNTGYQLTPQQMIDLTNAALAYIQGIYQQSWQLKDAVTKAKTQDEIAVIEWL